MNWLLNTESRQIHYRPKSDPRCNLAAAVHTQEIDEEEVGRLLASDEARLCDWCTEELR